MNSGMPVKDFLLECLRRMRVEDTDTANVTMTVDNIVVQFDLVVRDIREAA